MSKPEMYGDLACRKYCARTHRDAAMYIVEAKLIQYLLCYEFQHNSSTNIIVANLVILFYKVYWHRQVDSYCSLQSLPIVSSQVLAIKNVF